MWDTFCMTNFAQFFASTAAAVVQLGTDAAAIARLDDDDLLAAQALLMAHREQSDTFIAWIVGEITKRSQRDTGYAGLAQRKGFGSPEALIQSVSQATRAEAARYVQLGTLMSDAAAPASASPTPTDPHDQASHTTTSQAPPWQVAIAGALSDTALSLNTAEAIRRGLGDVSPDVSEIALVAACEQLIAEASTLTVDQLLRRARVMRDALDEHGIAHREQERRDGRYLKRWIRPDGMYQGTFLLDPENGREVFSALDNIIAPRRGGPRFIDKAGRARAEVLIADPRTDAQLLADAFVEMIRLAVLADPGTLFGSRLPAVRVVVTEQTLCHAGGHGFIEGDDQSVSRETIDRHVCNAGMIGIKFDDTGQCVNVGRAHRLFTERQRIALGVRDGGCMFGDCSRPPSYCEAHHIDQWHRDHGSTNVADGILLCRHHHMLAHNNNWQIMRKHSRYWLKPPRSEDPNQTLRPLSSKSPIMRELQR